MSLIFLCFYLFFSRSLILSCNTIINNVTDCDNYFKKSLFLVGEIGGNDYNYAFIVGGSIKQVRAAVPPVVEAITRATSVSLLITEFYFQSCGSETCRQETKIMLRW